MKRFNYTTLTVISFALIAMLAACSPPPTIPTPATTPVVTLPSPSPASQATPLQTQPAPPTQRTQQTQQTPPTQPPASPVPTPATTSPNAGQLADAGKNVYAQSCAKCHGEKGEGVFAPALIGPSARLETYSNAKGLIDFISSAMPMDAPGRLSQQQYLQVLSFLLIQNGLAQPTTIINPGQLGQIQLKKNLNNPGEREDDSGRGRGRGRGRGGSR